MYWFILVQTFTVKTSCFSNSDSCIFYSVATDNKPFIGRSTTIIEHIRRTDNSSKFLFNFYLDGTDERPGQLIVWSNQRIFNEMHFYFEVTYEPQAPLGTRPLYVHNTKVGITKGRVLLRVLDYNNGKKLLIFYFQVF